MSGKKRPPPTALARRASRDLSDADLSALLHQRNHLLGRKKIRATFDPEGDPVRMKLHNEEDLDLEAFYLMYDESLQRFVGLVRRGSFLMERPKMAGRSRMTFFPAAQA